MDKVPTRSSLSCVGIVYFFLAGAGRILRGIPAALVGACARCQKISLALRGPGKQRHFLPKMSLISRGARKIVLLPLNPGICGGIQSLGHNILPVRSELMRALFCADLARILGGLPE